MFKRPPRSTTSTPELQLRRARARNNCWRGQSNSNYCARKDDEGSYIAEVSQGTSVSVLTTALSFTTRHPDPFGPISLLESSPTIQRLDQSHAEMAGTADGFALRESSSEQCHLIRKPTARALAIYGTSVLGFEPQVGPHSSGTGLDIDADRQPTRNANLGRTCVWC